MLNDPVARAIAAKKITEESKLLDAEDGDTISRFDRDIVGAKRVDIRLPLNDAQLVMRHLGMIENTIHDLRLAAAKLDRDRSRLFLIRGTLRALSGKLNGKRWTGESQ